MSTLSINSLIDMPGTGSIKYLSKPTGFRLKGRPFVVYPLGNGEYEIVDGYHRYTTMLLHRDIYEREGGMLPCSIIDKDVSNRMASTIRHNRARGSHSIELMMNIVGELKKAGMSDAWIMKEIGMDADELLRFKQLSGLAELFRDREYSQSKEETI